MELFNRRHFFVSPLVLGLIIITYFSRHVLSRHHIRHHRDRFKRQQGTHLYLPGSYVTDGGEGDDLGPWTDWSSPSPCSRTCGGGVSSQYRQCTPGYTCQGPTKRHFSCNTQDCPDVGDFRAQQCSEFDNIPFESVQYQWIPYTKAPNPCELNCMPRGERFYYRHKSTVVDGTRCNDESLDVCVEGKCQPVGCDMMLGSSAREDKCRQCGGDDSTCNTITGQLNMQDMQPGYNDILLIPAGATNINVEEVSPSNNYLAIRNTSGHYYLNGNWRIDFPRAMDFAGVKFHYERYPQGFAAPDKITSLGPIDEALFIVLLFQDVNVGVNYEYSVPKSIQQSTSSETYAWTFDEFSPCSATCGGGLQYRNVSCAGRRTLEPADETLCDTSNEPSSVQRCNEVPCEPQWVAHTWENCSKACGAEGVQMRQVFCEQVISGGYPTLVDEKECLKVAPKPPEKQSCNQDAICAQWFEGPWKPCDHLCGEGKERRNVTCYRKNDETIEVLDDAYCQDEKPETEKSCNLRPCEGVDWVATEWSGCESKCGLANETRRVHCATSKGEVYPDNLCENSPLPELVRECKTVNKSCEFEWYASQWSECSAKCGSGVQTRKVACSSISKDGVKFVDDQSCDASKKYEAMKNCTGEQENCTGEWFSGPWGQCSKKCGGGERTRKVVCLREEKVVNSSECGSDTIVFSSETCNTDPCTEDTVLPLDVTKPADMPQAEAIDSDKFEIVEDDNCDDGEWVDIDDVDDLYDNLEPFERLQATKSGEDTASTESAASEHSTESTLQLEDLMLSDSMAFTDGTMSTAVSESIETGSGDQEISSVSTESSLSTSSGISDSSDILSTDEGSGDDMSSSSATDTSETATEALSSSTIGLESSTTESSSDSTTDFSSTSEGSTTEFSTTDSSTTEFTSTDITTEFTESTTNVATESTTDISSTESTSEGGTKVFTEKDVETSSSTITETSESTSEFSTTGVSESTTGSEASTEFSSTESSVSTESISEGSTELSSSSGATESTVSGSTEFTESTSDVDIWSSVSSTTEEGSTTSSSFWETTPVTDLFLPKKKMCKRPKISCKTTKFGCCMDQITPAEGPFDKGCSVLTTCKETKYGCCEDGVSPAKGKNFKDCPSTHCVETLFGCCSDNKTAAQGNDEEGCPPPPPECLKSKFGCCKDNVTEATGPRQKGCKKEEVETTTAAAAVTTTETGENCSNSTYGCCPDGIAAAQGEFFKGCDIFKENCTDSYFRCCPDGITSAEGPNYRGCKTPCSDSPYGCCADGVTPAHGYNREGCCLTSFYGCCPDNIVPAQGPHLEGCDCHFLPFGCCPDNVTAATGYNNAGCGCQHSQHGCCPDNYTEASGPEYEGCLCHTYQFGCCSDGVTIAKGPHQQGCDCRYSEFGCCSDDHTPAQGANFTGCTCASTKNGCCPDGVTEAQGENFEGCENVPEKMQKYCDLNKDRGTCRNYTVWWYFDTEYGGCSRFWYGGCDGNNNRFKTKDECEQICVQPTGDDKCSLPKNPGPCEGYFPKWYYDRDRKVCSQFIYGGCLGNNNNFETQQECADLCVKDTSADACEQHKEEGPCHGNYRRWFFDRESKNCDEFIYGGCKGNNNNFLSESACKQKCAQPGRKKDHCSLPRAQGNCTEKLPRWYYDTPEKRCVPFYYSGCNGNNNNFVSKEACEVDCPKEVEKDICHLPAEVGECGNYVTHWYYDVLRKACTQFYYGGCGGNGNNFASQELCEARCERPLIPATEAPALPQPPPVYQPPESQAPSENVCFAPLDPGTCNDSIPAYFYDAANQACAPFSYSGCGGNVNRYNSEEQCERQCGKFRGQDVCNLPQETGPCRGYFIKYYYDSRIGRCGQFVYGGCDGNANRFSSAEECESICVTHEERKPNETSSDICRLPVDQGACEGGYHKRWYFDIERAECIAFIYSGCGGNFNRFKSFQDCINSCQPLIAQTESPINLGPEREPHPCQSYFDECPTLRCAYGIEAYVDDNQCNRCQCHEPCKTVDCPEGFQCAIDLNRNRTQAEDPTFVAVCRETNKDGQCPRLSDNNCERECNNDADCTLDLKCCYNGCGTACVVPAKSNLDVPAELVTTGYLPAYTEPPFIQPGYYAPQVEEEIFVPEVQAGEGDYATLKCAVRGNPTPSITWSKENILIDGQQPRYRILLDQSLQIITLHKTDSGIYLCTADNKVGEPLRKEIQLIVTDSTPHAASVLDYEGSPNVVVSLGAPATLNCDAIGFPFPAVTWWKDDSLIPLKTTQFEVRKDYSLLIHSIQLSNLGVYTCQAYNGIGKAASWSVTVRALGPYHSTDPADEKYLKYIVGRPQPPTTEAVPPLAQVRPQYPYRPEPGYRPTPQSYVPAPYTEPSPEIVPNEVQPAPEERPEQRPPAGVYINPQCTDNQFFANCKLIVKAKFCTHKYYSKFCCRSCTEAGQLSPYGDHLNEEKQSALSSNLV